MRGDGIYTSYVSAPSGAYSIYATFDEIGFSRGKDGTPLMPWNFWYFPYSHAADGSLWREKAVQPLAKYEAAFGKSEAMARNFSAREN